MVTNLCTVFRGKEKRYKIYSLRSYNLGSGSKDAYVRKDHVCIGRVVNVIIAVRVQRKKR